VSGFVEKCADTKKLPHPPMRGEGAVKTELLQPLGRLTEALHGTLGLLLTGLMGISAVPNAAFLFAV
jgi:hypothetical protein